VEKNVNGTYARVGRERCGSHMSYEGCHGRLAAAFVFEQYAAKLGVLSIEQA